MNGVISEGVGYSERPGFTLVGGIPTRIGPVVVRMDGSRESFEAIKTAVAQAMTRTCGLVVLDASPEAGTSDGTPRFDRIDGRERATAVGIFRNTNVSRVPTDPDLDALADQSEGLQASLLVLSSRDVEGLAETPEVLSRIMSARFDVLMLTPGSKRGPGG